MLDRDPQSFPQPSSHSCVCSGPGCSGAAEEARLGQTASLGWGDGVRAWPGWFKGQSVGYIFCTIFKGPTCSLHQLITEVQVKNSLRVNSISAEKQHIE